MTEQKWSHVFPFIISMKAKDVFDRHLLFDSIMSKAALLLACLALLPSPGHALLHSISVFSLRAAGFSSRTGRAPKIYPLSACLAPEENLASIPRRQAIFGIALAGTLILGQPACAADARFRQLLPLGSFYWQVPVMPFPLCGCLVMIVWPSSSDVFDFWSRDCISSIPKSASDRLRDLPARNWYAMRTH